MASPASPPTSPPVTIGWKEVLALPDLGIERIKAKVDTGARTTALHVDDLRDLGGGELELVLSPDPRRPERRVTTRARQVDEVEVTNSGGGRERRPVIETTLRLGPVTKPIRVTLTDRSTMLFRIILGRKALEGDFLVDVSASHLHGGRRGRG